MDQDQNPVRAQGFRNVLCPHYGTCLDHVVKNRWECWACTDCRHQREQILISELFIAKGSADPYYSISPSLYIKDKRFSF